MNAESNIEKQLRESEERLALAVAGTQDGIWDWNLIDNSLYMSPRWKEILGYDDAEIPSNFNTFEDNLHPGEKAGVMDNLRKYLNGEIDQYRIQYRMKHRNGSYRWILSRGAGIRDKEGKIYRMAGSHTDITDRKMEEERFRIFA